MAQIIVIAGGIGSGKSVVSRVLRCMGYEVYDCDSRAKLIMDESMEIKRAIARRVSSRALLDDCSLDRKHLAEVVFSDKAKLAILNEIVHAAVRNDIADWAMRHVQDKLLFVETAIPRSSGLDEMVNAVWIVEAPVDVRIERVCARNGIDREAVLNRIESQRGETEIKGKNVAVINNDGRHSLLLQIDALLAKTFEAS